MTIEEVRTAEDFVRYLNINHNIITLRGTEHIIEYALDGQMLIARAERSPAAAADRTVLADRISDTVIAAYKRSAIAGARLTLQTHVAEFFLSEILLWELEIMVG